MKETSILKISAACAILLLSFASFAAAQDVIHIWVKGFLPKDHPNNPGYVKPAVPGKFVIQAPVGNTCYLTDNRMFSSDPTASARLTTEFVLTVKDTATVGPAGPTAMERVGPTHHVDCSTGNDVEPAKTAGTDHMTIGTPAFADGMAQVAIDSRASNPFISVAPDIHFSGTFTYTRTSGDLRFLGSTGVFPAFEAYAQLNNGPVKTLFNLLPLNGTTVVSLIELGTGLQQQAVDVKVTLK